MLPPDLDSTTAAVVAELAAFHADDIAAILAALGAGERKVVEDLLRGHNGRFEASFATPGRVPAYDSTHLSGWLTQRLNAAREEDPVITRLAGQTLLSCVADLYPAAGGPGA
jgi:anti-sigma factor RsiW